MSYKDEITNLQDAMAVLVKRLRTPEPIRGGGNTGTGAALTAEEVELLASVQDALELAKNPTGVRPLLLTQTQLQSILFAMVSLMSRLSSGGDRLGPENTGGGH